jgi:hypothetical protein
MFHNGMGVIAPLSFSRTVIFDCFACYQMSVPATAPGAGGLEAMGFTDLTQRKG